MAVAWTEHRFAGGVLALDAANTVVLRNDPERTFDRFAEPREIGRFAEAASRFRAKELGGRAVAADDPAAVRGTVLAIRNATDALFRTSALGGETSGPLLASFLEACARGLKNAGRGVGDPDSPFGDSATPLALEAAMAVSALSLLEPEKRRRLKVCANCDWLFLDRSRNSSRMWCDMKVCGNRRKAQRHYHRHKSRTDGHDHA